MMISLLGFSVLISTPAAFAQSLGDLPTCATKCLTTAFGSIGNACAPTDFACFCKNPDFISANAKCYAASCSPAELAIAQKVGAATCGAAGVQLPAPAAANGGANAANGAGNGASGAGSAANGTGSAANKTGNAAHDTYTSGANAANATAHAPNGTSTGSASNNNSTPAGGNPAPSNSDSAAAGLSIGATEALLITSALISSFLMI